MKLFLTAAIDHSRHVGAWAYHLKWQSNVLTRSEQVTQVENLVQVYSLGFSEFLRNKFYENITPIHIEVITNINGFVWRLDRDIKERGIVRYRDQKWANAVQLLRELPEGVKITVRKFDLPLLSSESRTPYVNNAGSNLLAMEEVVNLANRELRAAIKTKEEEYHRIAAELETCSQQSRRIYEVTTDRFNGGI